MGYVSICKSIISILVPTTAAGLFCVFRLKGSNCKAAGASQGWPQKKKRKTPLSICALAARGLQQKLSSQDGYTPHHPLSSLLPYPHTSQGPERWLWVYAAHSSSPSFNLPSILAFPFASLAPTSKSQSSAVPVCADWRESDGAGKLKVCGGGGWGGEDSASQRV